MLPQAAVNILRDQVEATVAEGCIPSISLAVWSQGHQVFLHTAGRARLEPARPACIDQPYDLASLTKALAGSTVTAALMARGALDLDTRVADHLPAVAPTVRLRHLLTHSSGLPKWNDFYSRVTGAWGLTAARRDIVQAACRTPLEAPVDVRQVYTDVGFLVLLGLLEQVGGARLDVLFQDLVLGPAGETELRWGWPRAAATEDCPVRGHVVEGTVHDLNCAALGGISTHAGLFGPARAVARFADALRQAVADPSAFPELPGAELGALWALRGAGSHAGGWDRISRDGYTSTGTAFPDDAIGHLGYTGTSVWVVPSAQVTVALLSNRVHPVDDLAPIRAARPRLHDAVARALGWVSAR